MTDIVDDYTSADFNSYASLAFIRQFNELRGQTLPSDDAVVCQYAVQAFDEINSFRDRFEGEKIAEVITGQFPRQNLTIDGVEVPDDEIPLLVMQANAELVFIRQSINFREATSGAGIVRERVGPIETVYSVAEGQSNRAQNSLPTVEALLQPLFRSGGAFSLSSVRL